MLALAATDPVAQEDSYRMLEVQGQRASRLGFLGGLSSWLVGGRPLATSSRGRPTVRAPLVSPCVFESHLPVRTPVRSD